MILAVVSEMAISPDFNPASTALARRHIVTINRIARSGSVAAATSAMVVVVGWWRWSTSALLEVAHVTGLWAGADLSTAPVGALAVLGVEAGAFRVLIARVSAIIKAVNVMIFSVVCKVSVCPDFNPAAGALAWQFIVTCGR